jgi:hypothetical protein
MAIRSTSVQRPANVDGLGYHMIDSDPDQMGSSAKASVDVDDVTCVGPTDAGFQAINEAPAQPLSSASPRSASSSRCRSPELSWCLLVYRGAHKHPLRSTTGEPCRRPASHPFATRLLSHTRDICTWRDEPSSNTLMHKYTIQCNAALSESSDAGGWFNLRFAWIYDCWTSRKCTNNNRYMGWLGFVRTSRRIIALQSDTAVDFSTTCTHCANLDSVL